MLSRETFVKAINEIKRAWDYQEDLNKFFSAHKADGYIYQPDCADVLIMVIEDAMGLERDADGMTDVSWFVYEMDFGRNFKMGDLVVDGKEVDVSDAEKLYDYVTGAWEEKKEDEQ